MSRIIKFRFWHSEEERMYEFDLLTYMATREDGQEDLCPSGADRSPMQFTGLTDKNGKEIYEGDLLKSGGNKLWEVRYGLYGWEVYNHRIANPNHRFAGDEKYDFKTFFQRQRQLVEIIGNVFENRELIKP